MKKLLMMLMAFVFLFAGCCNCGDDGSACNPTGSNGSPGTEHANTKLLVIPGSIFQIDLTVEDGKLYNFSNADGKPRTEFTKIVYAGFNSGRNIPVNLVGLNSVTLSGLPAHDRFNVYLSGTDGQKYWLNLGHASVTGATVVGDAVEF